MSSDRWFVRSHGQPVGPFTRADLARLAAVGQFRPRHKVRKEGDGDWVQAGLVAELFPTEPPADPGVIPDWPAEPLGNGIPDAARPARVTQGREQTGDRNPWAAVRGGVAAGWAEARATAGATGAQAGRLGRWVAALAGRSAADQRARTFRRNLGKELHRLKVGDPAALAELEVAAGELIAARAVKAPTRTLRRRYDEAALRLADGVLAGPAEPPGAEAEAAAAQGAIREARDRAAAAAARRAALLPAAGRDRVRVAVGLAALACGLAVAGVALPPGRRPAPPANAPAATSPEAVVRAYLDAPRWEDRLGHVLDPDRVRPLMADRYRSVPFTVRYSSLAAEPSPHGGDSRAFRVVFGKTRNAFGVEQDDDATVVVLPHGGGWKVDWKATVGYNPMPLTQFKADRPGGEFTFRVGARASDIYRGPFEADAHYAFDLATMAWGHQIADRVYGYARRGSAAGRRMFDLLKRGGPRYTVLVVRLRYPPGVRDGTACEVTDVVREGWLDDPADDPGGSAVPPPPARPAPAPARPAPAPTRPGLADGKGDPPGLSRAGYIRTGCLVCRASRSAAAVAAYSDRCGFGLCGACGAAYREWEPAAQAAVAGRPPTAADAAAAKRFEAVLMPHVRDEDTDAHRGLMMMLWTGKFGSGEWHLLTGCD